MDRTPPQKLRLMCSYGGQILPKPNTKPLTLTYTGGDTRIISINTSSASTLPSFTSAISAALNIPLPFTCKYQLPHHSLDSLISLSTDEDIAIMLDEHVHASRGKKDLHVKESGGKGIFQNPKTEAWFVDALKGVKIGGGNEGEGQESVVLETGSSFGSGSSSSVSNLAMSGKEYSAVGEFQESKVKLPSVESYTSDNSVASSNTQPQISTYQDPLIHLASNENIVPSQIVKTESDLPFSASGTRLLNLVPYSGIPASTGLDAPQQQQVFVHPGMHYISHNSATVLAPSSDYPLHHPQLQQQPQVWPHQPHPLYFMPVGQMQTYGLNKQTDMLDNRGIVTSQSPLPQHPSSIPSEATYYKDVSLVAPRPELASETCITPHSVQPAHAPFSGIGNQQQVGYLPHAQNEPQSVVFTVGDSANNSSEFADDPTRAQIYKSQPPPPTLPLQYQTES